MTAVEPIAPPAPGAVEARAVALDCALAPADAALALRGDARPFALIGRWAGGRAILGSEPLRAAGPGDDPFALLDEQPPVAARDVAAVGGGWFGFLGHGLARRLERVSPSPPRPVALQPFALAFYDHVLRCDAGGGWWFEALWSPGRDDALRDRLETLRARLARPPERRPFATTPFHATPGDAGHAAAVAACRERIRAGDLFQANVTMRLQAALTGDPLDLFGAGTAALPSDRAAYIAGPWGALASLSPELFLERHGRTVRTAPIKGTRALGADPAELEASAKDRAENVMIVDLMRNDLGRVCAPGTVRVEALAEVRAHAGVWHLVSEVAGELADGVGDGELVAACFPPGSVTGAPKLAALDVIAELESTGREAYCGAIGFAGPLAGLELNVAIRTFETDGRGRVWLGAGGGVVADSDPAAETREARAKAAPLLRAIGAREAAPAGAPGSARVPRRLGPRPVPRPDPAAGVFETVLVEDGRAARLDLHLARLRASVRALYGGELGPGLEGDAARAAAAAGGRARLRIDACADGTWSLQASGAAAPTGGATLASAVVPGGLGAHKWADRELLDALTAAAGAAIPLLVDLDGNALEASVASVFAVDGSGTLRTPPTDGRILPGVTRGLVLAAAARAGVRVHIGPVAVDDLLSAAEVFITSALRRIQPTAVLDGHALAGAGAVTARIAAGLG